MDRLLRPCGFLAERDAAWQPGSPRWPWEMVAIRLGGWLVLLSSLLWPTFYWPELGHFQRVLCVGFPALALNLMGWQLHRMQSRWNSRIFLGTGALLLPLWIAVMLAQYGWFQGDQGSRLELLASFAARRWEFAPTNLQLTLAAAVFVAYCVVLLKFSGARLFIIWLGVGVYLLFTGVLLLCGLKEWIQTENIARALVCYLLLCILMLLVSAERNMSGRSREAAVLYLFFPVPLVAMLTALAWYGGAEWLGARRAIDSPPINLWWMANGGVYCSCAVASFGAATGHVRYWGQFFLLLVPASFLLPTNLLFHDGATWLEIGGRPVTAYELLCGILALAFIVVGTKTSRATLALPGLVGLSVFVFRVTGIHFDRNLSWPFWMAFLGGLAMLVGTGWSIARAKRSRGGP